MARLPVALPDLAAAHMDRPTTFSPVIAAVARHGTMFRDDIVTAFRVRHQRCWPAVHGRAQCSRQATSLAPGTTMSTPAGASARK